MPCTSIVALERRALDLDHHALRVGRPERRDGDEGRVEAALRVGASVDSLTEDGLTALMLAIALRSVQSWAPSGTHSRVHSPSPPRTRCRCAAVKLAAHRDVLLSELDTVYRHPPAHTSSACGA